MTFVRVFSLIGVGLLVMISNVLASILYMVIYGYLINPGHEKKFYDEHIKVAAPYCSIIAGIPLMFLAGMWVASWAGQDGQLGVKAALIVWLTYAIVDLVIVLATGGITAKLWLLIAISLLTKLGAAYAGARFAVPGQTIVSP